MYRLNVRFSLFALVLCMGFIGTASAAPSIRVLGANAGATKNTSATKATAVKTGNNLKASGLNSALNAKKSASIKTTSSNASVVIPVTKTAVNRIGTETETPVETQKETARFPGIMTKSNIQGNKISTDTTSNSLKPGYDIQDITNRLTNAESDLADKVDKDTLDDYYTKEEVEDIRTGYYTKEQVEDRLAGIDASASSQYIRFLTTRVNAQAEQLNLHDEQIQEILAQDGAIYDNASGEKVNISFISLFDADAVLGAE